MASYIDVSQEAGKRFFSNPPAGAITMLNLLRFKKEADYSAAPQLQPGTAISGAAAYQLYMEHTLPLLKKAGSEVLFSGKCNHFLIGPAAEEWDLMLLVKHESAAKFLAFAQDEAYLQGAGHRTAALADSRLLPIIEAYL